ncbi:MAG: pantoate--beta-alanine ligase [Candidatus Omnitrophota bacterium]
MKLIRSVLRMQNLSKKLRQKGKTIGFVPTMGYLHQGHLSLVRQSVKDADVTVMSIYVNPLQFGPKEDFKLYPRDIKSDMKLARSSGVDYVFIPSDQDMYAEKYLTTVEVNEISGRMCGASRPGHFKGVTTVVSKLFNIVLPDIAYFGQKDAQQAVIIGKMVKDLNMPVKVKVLPIIREPDGLAKSSRNIYLSPGQRKDAAVLFQALQIARKMIIEGERNPGKVILRMKRLISQTESVTINYIVIAGADDLLPGKKISGRTLIALAVFIGKVRLIDNIVIKVKSQKSKIKITS